MKIITELKPKEADAYKGSTFNQIEKAIEILSYELDKVSIIRRSLLSSGKEVFIPIEHGIEEYVPMK